jgi:mannose-1-phosphate guanylyltransferase
MLDLLGDRTLFQMAVDRLLPLLPPERILVVTAAEQVQPLSEQMPSLPKENFIVEPMGRGTAPCIGLSALHVSLRDPDAVMAVVTADHHIPRQGTFREVLVAAREVAEEGYLVTLGIKPDFPATGYGYIARGEHLGAFGGFDAYAVERFTEKPDAETAERFVESGGYAWNSGMFIWRASRILEEIDRWMPELDGTLETLSRALTAGGYGDALEETWPQVPKETIDYGIMERAERVAVIPVDLGWSDVGSWASVMDFYDADGEGNVILGDHEGVDTNQSMVFSRSDRLVATIGVDDLIVVDTPEALLITRRDQAERVREVVQRLREGGREDKL